ncbi:MAG TPA: hypothetical protein VJ396_03220 [Acidiferrobacterales bacterium]|nr:hypothetical protein [Acidiferrobacterales bacterium]
MNAVVIEHVKVSELPENWRARLRATANARVTVRIEEEAESREAAKENAESPLFGMWQDREEMADVDAYVRKLRMPRF